MRDEATRDEVMGATDRSFLVEAAAGTGKTRLIVDRILHGLRTGTLRLADTVAITFTEKAAGELEERIRSELARALSKPDLDPAERGRLRAAVDELDLAQVSTIHSFCARLLRERPVEAGVDPEFEILQEAPAALLREQCWAEWIEAQVRESAPALVEAVRAGIGTENLRAAAFALADAPELLELPQFELPAPGGDPDAIIAELRAAAAEARRACEKIGSRSNEDSRAIRDAAEGIGRSSGAEAARRRAYAAAGADLENAFKSFRGAAKDEVRPALERFCAACRAVGERLAAEAFAWLAGFVRHYADEKRARGALDFQDLLLVAARLLRTDLAARRHFQRQFAAVLVDEFQDTDPLQAEMIAYLCEEPGGGATRMEDVRLADGRLVAVGDPKQSIYRFRRADVQVYEQFKALFGPERVRTIQCNFRSTRPLLDWCNVVFERAFGAPHDAAVYQAEHVPLVPGRKDADVPGPAVLAVCPDVEDPDWKAPAARRREAHYLARIVRDAVDGRLELPGFGAAPTYADFGFLFLALTDADVYEEALEACGVPYRLAGGRHFYKRTQTEETLALLKAIDDPLDAVSVVAALRSTHFGLSDEDLLRHRLAGGGWDYLHPGCTEGPVAEAMACLADWHGRRNLVPPHVLLAQAFDATKAPLAYMLKPAGEQRAASLEQLLRRVRTLGRAARTFSAVVRHLSSMSEGELPEEEAGVVEPGDEFVQLLSMHKAKGLQFPVVVLADIGREFQDKTPPLLLNRRDGRVGLRFARGVRTSAYDCLEQEETGNRRAEERRLLYVACTRAERLLVLPLHWRALRGTRPSPHSLIEECADVAGRGSVPFGETHGGVHYLDTRGWAEQVDVSPAVRPLPEESEAEVRDALTRRAEWRAEHAALAARASAGARFVLPSTLDRERPADPLDPGAPAAAGGEAVGTLVHNLMGLVPLGGAAPDTVQALALAEADRLGLDEARVQEAARLVLDALGCPEFRALVAGAEAVAREVPFAVPLSKLGVPAAGEALVEGSVDLLLRMPDRTVVLDYKTDRRAEPEQYWPQLALYGLAARACGWAEGRVELALYFVRHGRIERRELDEALAERVGSLVQSALAGPEPDEG